MPLNNLPGLQRLNQNSQVIFLKNIDHTIEYSHSILPGNARECTYSLKYFFEVQFTAFVCMANINPNL